MPSKQYMDSIAHDGIQREYILYIPASCSAKFPVPLLINYHGYGSNAGEQMVYSNFRPVADTAGFLIVHPEGTLFNGTSHWNVGGWTVGSTADDVGFTDALLDSLLALYNIDENKIYATGMSNGGFMSFLLACQLSSRITAIASVTGSMTPETYTNSNPQHPMPILQMHGTSDPVVPYNGASWTYSIDDAMEYWVDYNACNPTPSITALPDLDPNDGSIVEHIVYEGGNNGVAVEHYKIIGGGHTWPGSVINLPGTNYDINASAEIWKFFSRYDINGLIQTTNIEELGPGNPILYPNPTKSFVNVEMDLSAEVDYKLISTQGRIIQHGVIGSTNRQIDMFGLPPNIYILRIGENSIKVLKTE
ncbi:MAG: T9SS type A sorting domain-containing protein [Bacteroidales bacterium]